MIRYLIPQHNSKWTKDHPLDNIISQLSRPVSIRLQLHEQALFCYYNAFLTSVEPKMHKDALTQSCWIEAMQEEINEFERLKARPTKKHLHAVKRIFRYLRGTVNQGLWYLKDSSVALTAFADVDHAGCQDTRRSTSGSLQFLGERLISWSSKRQKSAAISITKAEYIALSGLQISQSPKSIIINQSKYALESLKKYGFESCDPMNTLMVDKSKLDEDKEGKVVDPSNYRGMIGILLYLTASRPDLQFAICMCARSKHIDIRYHFIKEHVENGVIELYFINTDYQLADLFTKALGRDRIEFLINKLGMRSFTPETLKQLTDEVAE
nr:hypothetical protein [Tanacetum cinerariifolium]